MDILKTPHQKLLEEAGAVPATPGMAHTPRQMLMQESGIMPRFADGGAVQMSPQDMLAELIYGGRTPQHFASGGSTERMSPEFEALLNKLYTQQIYSGELPPEPTFQAQPVTLTSRARDATASLIGDLPADRLFGTGSEGQKTEYLPLQFLNPVSATTETLSAIPETARQLRQGDVMGAGITAGATGLGVLPFLKPIKSAIKKIKPKK
jgi:hypothetical protein